MALDAKQLVDQMLANFPPDKAAGLEAEIQLILSGPGGGNWVIKFAGGKVTATEGKTSAPRLTVTAGLADLIAVAEGKLDGMAAFMQGKIKLDGDVGLAMRMVNLFQRA
ncbi:MAG: SCP2 sterol-binding domain-containing protein [Anaerolineales bacterium]|nr:SCP2 sterol-binding domain-containing protein [Anaerolineales bacterium]